MFCAKINRLTFVLVLFILMVSKDKIFTLTVVNKIRKIFHYSFIPFSCINFIFMSFILDDNKSL